VPTATVTGDLTYYSPGLGACGTTASDGDMVCAVSRLVFDAAAAPGDSNPNHNPLCGRRVRVQRNAASVVLTTAASPALPPTLTSAPPPLATWPTRRWAA
jgi:hypothetical protein